MYIVAIDIETSGLNLEKHQILQFSAVFMDTENDRYPVEDLPSFNKIILHDEIVGEPYALNMNAKIIEKIKNYDKSQIDDFSGPGDLMDLFYNWLIRCLPVCKDLKFKITLAGKNLASFDLKFIEKLKNYEIFFKPYYHRRIIDPAILYVDWFIDTELPNLQLCLDRAGISRIVTHDALDDAQNIVRLIRKKRNLK